MAESRPDEGVATDRKKILLVDDVELFLSLEKSFLTRKSFEIHTATSGSEALEKARRIRPEIILVDLFMPDLDGDQICAELKKDPDLKKIPVIIVTAERDKTVLDRCIRAGCDRLIYKPFSRDSLLTTVKELLFISQRQFIRVPTDIQCTAWVGEADLDTTIHVLSQGGAFIEIGIPPDSGSSMEIGFCIPGSNHIIKTAVVVRWAASVRKDGPVGVGVQFTTISEQDKRLIQEYVNTRLKELRTGPVEEQ
jgi:CheY-like chemotaxis protein